MKGKTVHCKKEDYDIYIGRPSKWGNPFSIGQDGDRAEVLDKYRQWLESNPELLVQLEEIRGKVLGCWCSPKPCHGDILLEVAERQYKDNLMKGSLFSEG